SILSIFPVSLYFCSFLNHPPPPDLSTLSLHDALPIWRGSCQHRIQGPRHPRHCLNPPGISPLLYTEPADLSSRTRPTDRLTARTDRKSTRLNSSHQIISYAVFCLKKKNKKTQRNINKT